MKILIGSDHAGFELKNVIKEFLAGKGHEVKDYGAVSYDERDDYPQILAPLAQYIAEHPDEDVKGIVLGGSGQGEAMVCNRFPGVRAVVYYGGPEDIIKLSRLHNNANVLSLGARFMKPEEACKAVDAWLSTEYIPVDRHSRRNHMLDTIE